MNSSQIKTALDARLSRERVKALFIELIRVPSPQTALLEEEPLLKEFIRKAIEPRLRAMGVSDIRYDPMGNLVAHCGRNASRRSLLLVAHAMNQPPATMNEPYAGTVVDGGAFDLPGECVMGKGASEQKSSIAAMLHSLETVIAVEPDFPGRLTFICALSGETGKHDALRSAIEFAGVKADMALLYGNSLKITLGNRGRIDVFVTVKGAPCHSSRPQQGANAITGALEAIRLVTGLKLDKSHPDLGGQSLTVNRIRSYPESTHSVQERCEFTIDRRLLPGEDPELAFKEIRRALEPLHAFKDPVSGKSFGLEVRQGPFMHPSLVDADSPVVRALQAASLAMLGRPAETYYASAAFDQGYLNHIGIPTANYGPGEERYAHTDNDMASVERTFDAARVYAFLALNHLTRS